MRTYKFYTTEALLKDKDNLFNDIDTYVVMTSYSHCAVEAPLCRELKLNSHFEIFDANLPNCFSEEVYYSGLSYEDCLSLLAAIDYDALVHPDETVFVTACPQDVPFINKFFGEDSIIVIGGNENEEKI
jgi:hypothetical protein